MIITPKIFAEFNLCQTSLMGYSSLKNTKVVSFHLKSMRGKAYRTTLRIYEAILTVGQLRKVTAYKA
jgi:hypothetical protein